MLLLNSIFAPLNLSFMDGYIKEIILEIFLLDFLLFFLILRRSQNFKISWINSFDRREEILFVYFVLTGKEKSL